TWTTHRTPSWSLCSGTFVTVQTATPGAVNACPAVPTEPAWKSVKINEVESNGDKVADWVELVNNGTTPVDVSGWKILDNDPDHVGKPVVVPAGTTIAAGGHYAIYTELGQATGFGLGAIDSATLFLADGTTQVDSYAWTTHAATTYGRCPDGTGDFAVTTTSTRGAANACSPIRINEVESKDADGGHDWVELVNVSGTAVPVSGWTLKDSGDADAFTIPADTTVPANGHLALDTFAFGLGGSDSARLFNGTTLVDSYTWTTEAATTYGRCKDGLGDFTTTVVPTKGATNACPGLSTQPWDGSQSVRTADVANTWGADLSGLAFDPKDPDVVWGAQNKRGTLWKIERDGQSWVPAEGWTAGKDPRYTDGTGAPDTEGITVGPDGFLYAASERDNTDGRSGTSRMSVLRYDPSSTAATLTATDEWDLTAAINQA
ncbi:MAG: lamin tail domain-containing protein, partial [Actinomycetales bacterium]